MSFLEVMQTGLMGLAQLLVGGFMIYVILVTVVVHWYDMASRMPKWTWKYESQIHSMWMGAHEVKRESFSLRSMMQDGVIIALMLLVGYGLGLLPLGLLTCVVYVEGYLYFRYISPSRKLTPIYRIDQVEE